MRVNCLSYHFSSLQEYCGQVLLVRFYRLGKPESDNQVPCRVMSKIESYTSLCFSCFLNTWKDACSQNKDMCLLLQSPHSPHVPQCLPIQNFLGVLVEVNRTFSFLSICISTSRSESFRKENAILSVFFHLFQNKKQAKPSTLAEPCGLMS